MLTEDQLPKHIKKAVNDFKSDEDFDFEVFPSKFLIDGDNYYAFNFRPSNEKLIVRDDGAVLPLEKIKKVALIMTAYNTSMIHFSDIGVKWVKQYDKKGLDKLCKRLMSIKKYIEKSSSDEILNSFDSFIDTIKKMIEYQVLIEESVHKGFQQGIKTNNQEVVTEEDYKRMRKYNLDMVRNAYLQNEIQLNTERDRRIVLQFLAKKPKYWPIYLYAKFHDIRMLSAKDTEKVQTMNELKNMIFNEDVPLEEQPNAEEMLSKFRNPR